MYSTSNGFDSSKTRLWSPSRVHTEQRSPSPGLGLSDWPFKKNDDGHDTTTASGPRSAYPELHQFAVGGSADPTFRHGDEKPKRCHKSPAWWIAEIVSLIFGILSMIAIVVVLARADGNPPPDWPLAITLNTFVAFFTSMARAAFMMPIVEGLGQLKWMWFLSPSPKPLLDFQTFDEASRGSWGSLKLLIRFKGVLACLAAAITLSGFLSSTITQQAIVYPVIESESVNGTSTVARATTFSLYNGSTLVVGPHDTVREKLAVVNGAFFVPNETVPHTTPVCSSGECKWPLYGSLAVCHEVVNLTAQGNETLLAILRNTTATRLNFLFNATEAMLEDISAGRRLRALPLSFPLLMGPVPQPTGALNESVAELIINDQYIAYSDEPMLPMTTNSNSSGTSGGSGSSSFGADASKLKFLEIAFFFCTKTLRTEVIQGVSSTIEVGVRAKGKNSSPYSMNFGWNPIIYDCYTKGKCNEALGGLQIEMEPPPDLSTPEKFTVDIWTGVMASALIFATMYDALLIDTMRGIVSSNGGGIGQAFAPPMFGNFMTFTSPSPEAQLAGVRNISRNMAQSMTNLIREGSTSWMNGGGQSTAMLHGTVFTPQTFVQVRWAYIAMLASQLALASLFLIATIIETYRANMQVLKGSSLPVLCGLDSDTRNRLGGMSEFDALRERSRTTKVRLERSSTGGPGMWLGMLRRPVQTTRPEPPRPTTAGTATSWGSLSPWAASGEFDYGNGRSESDWSAPAPQQLLR